MKSLQEEIDGLAIGELSHYRNLTILPLLRPQPAAPDSGYLLLEEAIGSGAVRVTEIGEVGTVPELHFTNGGLRPVLLLDGEELIGAKQNRTLNLTILAAPNCTITIPVSCVEAGRWQHTSVSFSAAAHLMPARGRARRTSGVTDSMQDSGLRRSNQGEVWQDIEDMSERLQSPSPTGAMAAIFERHAVSLDDYARAFQASENQAGVAFAIGGCPVGFDLFDHPETLRKVFSKLVRSYAVDALDSGSGGQGCDRDAFLAFLGSAANAPVFSAPAIGMGKDLRLRGPSVSGAALWAESRYIHFCAFAADGAEGAPPPVHTRFASPRRRR